MLYNKPLDIPLLFTALIRIPQHCIDLACQPRCPFISRPLLGGHHGIHMPEVFFLLASLLCDDAQLAVFMMWAQRTPTPQAPSLERHMGALQLELQSLQSRLDLVQTELDAMARLLTVSSQ